MVIWSLAIMAAQSAFLALPPSAQAELERCGVTERALSALLHLDQRAFDQDFNGGGWRGIDAQEGCERAAAEAIKAYILYSTPSAPDDIKLLRWHAGQLLANGGFTSEALPFFAGSFSETYKGDGDADWWDIYVDATLAFLEGDRARLVAARDRLAAFPVSEEEKAARRKFLEDNPTVTMPPGFVDEPPNLAVVERLLACFGQPYAEAYAGDCAR
ncbi:MAG: hypothetical protein AAGH41_14140 [Pseudomonadota bacterium]